MSDRSYEVKVIESMTPDPGVVDWEWVPYRDWRYSRVAEFDERLADRLARYSFARRVPAVYESKVEEVCAGRTALEGMRQGLAQAGLKMVEDE